MTSSRTWAIPASICSGVAGTGAALSYGDLIARASQLLPNMLYAAVARSPVFGGRVRTFDAAATRVTHGVRDVVKIDRGVAVVAVNTWAAFQGVRALRATWDDGPAGRWSTPDLERALVAAAAAGGDVIRETGNVDDVPAGVRHRFEARFEAPFLAHACMEPMNCTGHVRDGECEILASTQNPGAIRREAARRLGLRETAVTVHVTYLGGGFGRRGGQIDYAIEAIDLAARLDAPVQVVWTREDDLRHGAYRPATYSVVRAALDAQGRPLLWHHRLAGPPGPGFTFTYGAKELLYPVPNFRLERANLDIAIPLAEWRGIGPAHNTWIIEMMVDEFAVATGQHPVAYRRALLSDHPRLVAVLDAAADRAGWGTPPPAGRHRGVALVDYNRTAVATVAEIAIEADGTLRVHRVVTAIDCGIVVNPDTVVAQTQSNVVYGLSAALYGRITLDRGRVVQSNFHDYRVMTMAERPTVDVHVLASDRWPSGVGEAALPTMAPAVCNAIRAGTGRQIRKLPIGRLA